MPVDQNTYPGLFRAHYTSETLFLSPYLDRIYLMMILPGGSPPTVVPKAGAVLQPRIQGHTSFTKNPLQTCRTNQNPGIVGVPTYRHNPASLSRLPNPRSFWHEVTPYLGHPTYDRSPRSTRRSRIRKWRRDIVLCLRTHRF